MKDKIKLIGLLAAMLLSGCIGPHASFSEGMQDNFAFTAADNVSASESKCIILTKPFVFDSGSFTFSLPAGKYIAKKKNESGYFYYSPAKITSTNWFFAPPEQGIYLVNEVNKGNLFGPNTRGYSDRPIRNVVLPDNIFELIKRENVCS